MLSERWIWGTFVKRRMLRGRQSFSTTSLQEKVCLWVETLPQTQSAGVQKTCQSHTWANLSESYQVSPLSGFCQGLWSLQTSIKGLHVSLRSALSVNVFPLWITWLVLLILMEKLAWQAGHRSRSGETWHGCLCSFRDTGRLLDLQQFPRCNPHRRQQTLKPA